MCINSGHPTHPIVTSGVAKKSMQSNREAPTQLIMAPCAAQTPGPASRARRRRQIRTCTLVQDQRACVLPIWRDMRNLVRAGNFSESFSNTSHFARIWSHIHFEGRPVLRLMSASLLRATVPIGVTVDISNAAPKTRPRLPKILTSVGNYYGLWEGNPRAVTAPKVLNFSPPPRLVKRNFGVDLEKIGTDAESSG